MLVSTGFATAQRRYGGRTLFTSKDLVAASRIGLLIEDVADNDSVDDGVVGRDVQPESLTRQADLELETVTLSLSVGFGGGCGCLHEWVD